MGGGRKPCCDKTGLKKGPWTPAEDLRLISFIRMHGHGNWRALPKQAGLSLSLSLYIYIYMNGWMWSKIASYLPGRTDNEIKNVWNTHLKKRLELKEPNPDGNESKESSITSSSSFSNSSVSYENQDKEMENGEQAHPGSMSQSPPPDMVIMGKNEDPLVELVPIEPSVNIWEIFDDSIDNEREKVGDKAKELSNSSSFSSTTCSYSSDVPNSNHIDPSIPEIILEIPFEPNLNFWDMLDDDQNFFTSNEVQICELEGHQHSTIEEEHNRDFESRRWVTYLENELGLLATSEDNQESLTWDATDQPLDPCSSSDETLWKAEIDPVATYFQTSPSSPHSLSL
ncbi:hypothetical protein HHK36_004710 [Tetracentron sinense]|uniref:Uncharacterized protein n=1 Tax=Tetracentron sinense TaxID=13715 RepID=A0A835DM44_TETSI|nr:hypothetical protein HHK36_004710 [Tetracentron sinense]